MSNTLLSRIPFVRGMVDERFLEHRRRSLAAAGLSAVLMAGVLFEYHLFAQHAINWDLAIILLTALVVKFSCFAWHRLNG